MKMPEKKSWLAAGAPLLAVLALLFTGVGWTGKGEVGARADDGPGRLAPPGVEAHGPPGAHAGSILPLKEVWKRVEHRIRGRIIEIEFEYEDGLPVYEFKYIMPNGRVRELYVDARTARVVKEEDDD